MRSQSKGNHLLDNDGSVLKRAFSSPKLRTFVGNRTFSCRSFSLRKCLERHLIEAFWHGKQQRKEW